MLAMRAARAFTGHTKIAKFEGAYHGAHDYAAVDVSAGSAIGAVTRPATPAFHQLWRLVWSAS